MYWGSGGRRDTLEWISLHFCSLKNYNAKIFNCIGQCISTCVINIYLPHLFKLKMVNAKNQLNMRIGQIGYRMWNEIWVMGTWDMGFEMGYGR